MTRRLVQMGCHVHALVTPRGDLWRLKDVLPSLTLHVGDITDAGFVHDLIVKTKPSVVYHLATYGAYSHQLDVQRILTTNMLGTWNLLRALEGTDYKVFVNTGSSSEYGFKKTPMQEADVLEPNSYYAVAKSSQTMLCQYAARLRKKNIVTFRLFSVYGPYEDPSRLVPVLINSCLQGKTLQMASPQTARDFIFVEDVIEAYLCLDQLQECGGQIINIATGHQSSLREITDMVINLTDAKVKVSWDAMPSRIWDSALWVGDVGKAQRLLKWQARTPLVQGLKQTIDWSKQHYG